MVIYHNNRCRKSREALKLLEQKGYHPNVVEYLKNPPTQTELEKVVEKLKIHPEQLVRKNETLYKQNFKNKDFSEAEWLQIMIQNPVLIERPIVINNEKAVVARPAERIEEVL